MQKTISFEELIIDLMPFSEELATWCKSHTEFLTALKIIYSHKFLSLGAVIISHSPYQPNDEVIGIYTYDYGRKNPIFKQDFIINKEGRNKLFVLYTRNNKIGPSKYVKDINDFYLTYGKGSYYVNSHHLTFEELPDELKPRALQIIMLAQKLGGGKFIRPTEKQIISILKKLKKVKKGLWMDEIKLKKTDL